MPGHSNLSAAGKWMIAGSGCQVKYVKFVIVF